MKGLRGGRRGVLYHGRAMIRMRQQIDRGRRHPVLGPVLIILLVLMLAMTMLHEGNESTGADLSVLCIGIMLLLLRELVPRPTTPATVLAPEALVARAPPSTFSLRILAASGGPGTLPLRL